MQAATTYSAAVSASHRSVSVVSNRSSSCDSSQQREQVTLLSRRPTVYVRLRNFPSAHNFQQPVSAAAANHNNNSNNVVAHTPAAALHANVKSRVESGKRKPDSSHTQQQQKQQQHDLKSCVDILPDSKTVVVTSQHRTNYSHVAQQQHSFEFDGAFSALDPEHSQPFQHHGMLPRVDDKVIFQHSVSPIIKLLVTQHVPGMVAAYGATASGKTATLFGGRRNDPLSVGLVSLAAEELLKHYSMLFLSVFEVYLDTRYTDLLTSKEVQPQCTPEGLRFQNLSRWPVRRPEDLAPLLAACQRQRKVGQTERNARSSRSSAVLHLLPVLDYERVEDEEQGDSSSKQQQQDDDKINDGNDNEDGGNEKEGASSSGKNDNKTNNHKMVPMVDPSRRLTIVDLAGSERAQTVGATTALQHRESATINLSLSNLGRTIQTLAEMRVQLASAANSGGGNNQQAAATGDTAAGVSTNSNSSSSSIDAMCRSSALTWALRDELQLRGAVSFVIAISPSQDHSTETLSSLRFAAMLRAVRQVITIKPILPADLKPATSVHVLSRSKTAPSSGVAVAASPSSKSKAAASAASSSSVSSPQPKKATATVNSKQKQQQQQPPASTASKKPKVTTTTTTTTAAAGTQWSPQQGKNGRAADAEEDGETEQEQQQQVVEPDSMETDYMNALDKVVETAQPPAADQDGEEEEENESVAVKAMAVRSDIELYAPFFEPSPSRSRSRSDGAVAAATAGTSSSTSSSQRTTASPFSTEKHPVANVDDEKKDQQQQQQEMLAICALNAEASCTNSSSSASSSLCLLPTTEGSKSNPLKLTVTNDQTPASPLLNLSEADIFVVGTRSVVREYLAFLSNGQQAATATAAVDDDKKQQQLSVFCTLLPEKDFSYNSAASLDTSSCSSSAAAQQRDAHHCISPSSCFILSRSRAGMQPTRKSGAVTYWCQFWNQRAFDEQEEDEELHGQKKQASMEEAATFNRLFCRITRAAQPRHVDSVSVHDAEGVAVEIKSGDTVELSARMSTNNNNTGRQHQQQQHFFFLQMRAMLMCSAVAPCVPVPPSAQQHSAASLEVSQHQEQQHQRSTKSRSSNSSASSIGRRSTNQHVDAFGDIPFVESGSASVVAASITASSASPTPSRRLTRAGSSQHHQYQQQVVDPSPPRVLFPNFPPLVPRSSTSSSGSGNGSKSRSNSINQRQQQSRAASNPSTEPSPTRPGKEVHPSSASSTSTSSFSTFGSGALDLTIKRNGSSFLAMAADASTSSTAAEQQQQQQQQQQPIPPPLRSNSVDGIVVAAGANGASGGSGIFSPRQKTDRASSATLALSESAEAFVVASAAASAAASNSTSFQPTPVASAHGSKNSSAINSKEPSLAQQQHQDDDDDDDDDDGGDQLVEEPAPRDPQAAIPAEEFARTAAVSIIRVLVVFL